MPAGDRRSAPSTAALTAEHVAWLIALRWWVPPAIGLAVLVGRLLGAEPPLMPMVGVAAAIWVYNGLLAWLDRRLRPMVSAEPTSSRGVVVYSRLALLAVSLDYAALFALIQLSGGAASPLVPFLLVPIVFAAILLGPRPGWLVAGVAVAGLAGGIFLDWTGIVAIQGIGVAGRSPAVSAAPLSALLYLGCFATAAFGVAGVTARLAARLRSESGRAVQAQAFLAEERARFLLQVAHNLRAPLDASLSMLDVVRQGYAGELGEPQRQTLDRVRNRLAALATLVSELLLLGRTREMPPGGSVALLDLAALARTAAQTFAEAARQRSLQLQVELPDLPVWLVGDPAILGQAIENLLANGLKYTPPGGTVWLAVAAAEDRAWLRVRDTGIGIPLDDQARLFEPFFRAQNARSVDGTGLGLAFVKEAVERHRGTVAVSSREGAGSEFVISLPLAEPPTAGP